MNACSSGVAIFSLLICMSAESAVARWQRDGVPINTLISIQERPVVCSDMAGGAIIAWSDFRTGAADIYVQRIDAAGVPQWTPGGVALCTAANNQLNPAIMSDEGGGALVAWEDYRGGITA